MQKKYWFHCLLFLLIYTLLNFYQLPVLLKEVTGRAHHPDQFVQGSAYFNEAIFNLSKFDHINLQNFYNVVSADSLYLHNYDFYTDAHFIASVYQAITTGRDIKKENGSYNFAGGRGLVDFRDEIVSNNKFIPTNEEVKNMVGLYATAYNNIANLIYTVLSPPPPPDNYVLTDQQKIELSQRMTRLHQFKIFIHGVSWSLLMFAVAVRFNLVFAWIIALVVLFFPGTHRHSIIWVHAFTINGFLPAYILYFYPYIQLGEYQK